MRPAEISPRRSSSMNLFHCLGCDAAGSVIDLVMKLDGIDFRAAVDQLLTAHPSLCRASELEPKPVDRKSTIPPEQAAQLLERVVELYAKTFGEVDEGGKYLAAASPMPDCSRNTASATPTAPGPLQCAFTPDARAGPLPSLRGNARDHRGGPGQAAQTLRSPARRRYRRPGQSARTGHVAG